MAAIERAIFGSGHPSIPVMVRGAILASTFAVRLVYLKYNRESSPNLPGRIPQA
jgi:hypothetical protein